MSSVRTIDALPSGVTAFVGYAPRGPTNRPTAVTSFAEYESRFGTADDRGTLALAVRGFFENGGRHALVVGLRPGRRRTAARLVPRSGSTTGLFALRTPDRFDLVCVPPVRRGGVLPPAVVKRAAAFCASRRALLVLDGAPSWRSPSDLAGLEPYRGRHDANVAVYIPRIRAAGSLLVPSSGAVAGVMARTDTERGVWISPAGTTARVLGAAGLAFEVAASEVSGLASQGVNPLRTLSGSGIVVWGARTFAAPRDAEWKYVAVRRLFLFLEESLDRGTDWAVFEPNGDDLWTKIRASVESFLTNLWRAGALQGRTQNEAYFVRCDRSTMTQADIDEGLIIFLVGVAPVRPAEFVIIRIAKVSQT